MPKKNIYQTAEKIYLEILERAKKENFGAHNTLFSKTIELVHGDGSKLKINNASVHFLPQKEEKDLKLVSIFSEHLGNLTFYLDDIASIQETSQINQEKKLKFENTEFKPFKKD